MDDLSNPDCLFCKIIKGDIPANIIYEDENVLAFADIAPVSPVHYLIIPKHHIPSALEVPPEIVGHIQVAVQAITKTDGLSENGFRLVTNVGRDGAQTIAHAHWHLLGGRVLAWPPG